MLHIRNVVIAVIMDIIHSELRLLLDLLIYLNLKCTTASILNWHPHLTLRMNVHEASWKSGILQVIGNHQSILNKCITQGWFYSLRKIVLYYL